MNDHSLVNMEKKYVPCMFVGHGKNKKSGLFLAQILIFWFSAGDKNI